MKVFFFLIVKKLVKAVLGNCKITKWGHRKRVSYLLMEIIHSEILQFEIQVSVMLSGNSSPQEEVKSEM